MSQGGECQYGEACKYKHDVLEYLKTKKADIGPSCLFFEAKGTCPYGLNCRFGDAHTDKSTGKLIDRRRREEEPLVLLESKAASEAAGTAGTAGTSSASVVVPAVRQMQDTINVASKALQISLRKKTYEFPLSVAYQRAKPEANNGKQQPQQQQSGHLPGCGQTPSSSVVSSEQAAARAAEEGKAEGKAEEVAEEEVVNASSSSAAPPLAPPLAPPPSKKAKMETTQRGSDAVAGAAGMTIEEAAPATRDGGATRRTGVADPPERKSINFGGKV